VALNQPTNRGDRDRSDLAARFNHSAGDQTQPNQ
jgi:hypothetical protein